MYIYRVYPAMFKTTAKLSEENRNKSCSFSFQWRPLSNPRLYCYHFLPSLYMNQVPEKLWLGQWLHITNIYPL